MRAEKKKWNYSEAVSKTRPLARQWARSSIEFMRELYNAKEFFAKQKGGRKNPKANNLTAETWKDFCEEVGVSHIVVERLLKIYTASELSKATKLKRGKK